MKYLLTILILLLPLTASAQDTIARAYIDYKGTKGYFFEESIGDKMLADLETFKLQTKAIATYELKIIKLQDKLELLEINLDLTEQIVDKWKVVAEEQATLAQKAESRYTALRDKKDKWYRQPVTWMGVGMIVGGMMAVGITFGIREAKEGV